MNDKKSWLTKPVWGNSSLLKGSDTRSLPSTQPEINRKFDISHLEKSHKHFGGGELSYGRYTILLFILHQMQISDENIVKDERSHKTIKSVGRQSVIG